MCKLQIVFIILLQRQIFASIFTVLPGTNWCGVGNNAKNADDLGVFTDTDKCCREHDLCPDYIDGYETKYGLYNSSPFATLHCDCDEQFRRCLKSANCFLSNRIGWVYFTGMTRQCFKKEYPIISCKNHSFFARSCLEYELDYTKNKKYQFFDLLSY